MATVARSADPRCPLRKPLDDDSAIHAIPIANDISWRLFQPQAAVQFDGNPMALGRAVTPSHTSVAGSCRSNPYNTERDRGDYEQIQRPQCRPVWLRIKVFAALRRWPPSPAMYFGHVSARHRCNLEPVRHECARAPQSGSRRSCRKGAGECPPVSLAGHRAVAISSASQARNPALWPRITVALEKFSQRVPNNPGANDRVAVNTESVNVTDANRFRGCGAAVELMFDMDTYLRLQRSPPEQSRQGPPVNLPTVAHRQRVSTDSPRSRSAVL